MNLPEIKVARIALCQDCGLFDDAGILGYCKLRKDLMDGTDRACRAMQARENPKKKNGPGGDSQGKT
jgi:hypothetical protein